MYLFTLSLLLNVESIMIVKINKRYENTKKQIGYIMYEDINRLAKWSDFKEINERFGYLEENFEESEKVNLIKISIFIADEKLIEDEKIREYILNLGLDMVHAREFTTQTLDVYCIQSDILERTKSYIVEFLKYLEKYLMEKENIKNINKIIRNIKSAEFFKLTQGERDEILL